MYVEDFETNISPVSVESDASSELSDLDAVGAGNDGSAQSGESIAETNGTSGTDAGSFPDVSAGDIGADISGLSSESTLQIVSTDNTEVLETISEGVSALNSLLFLIFVFLILEWTEKKIFLSVRKFTHERRR